MLSKKPVYFDFAASTPLDPRVAEVMLPYFAEHYGNPSSIHLFGQEADAAVETARLSLAKGMNCSSSEVIFTSCGTESDNLALRGVAFAIRAQRSANHILVPPTEHHAVSRTAQYLARYHGFDLEYLPVDQFGITYPEDVASRLRPTTALVSIMYANNEIGSINPISAIGEVCRSHGVPFHTDAVQAAAYLPVDVQALNVDLLSVGAHKFYGPKGVGALFVRKGTPIFPQQTGGSQESGFRAGTSNVPYIVAMAKAFELAQYERESRTAHVLPLRNRLIRQVLELVPDSKLTGHTVQRLPNHASFVFQNINGNDLLINLDMAGFACSSGSACKTGSPEPSEVLTALGLSSAWALGSLRLTLGSSSSPEDVEELIAVLPGLIEKMR